MKKNVELLIKKYCLLKFKYDFMGYPFDNINELSYHHLIIPHIDSQSLGYGKGIYNWNGVILKKSSSHAYLHLIEQYDLDRFLSITSELLDEKIKGYIDFKNIYYINDILCSFEKEFSGVKNYKGKPIIKEEYTRRRIKNT